MRNYKALTKAEILMFKNPKKLALAFFGGVATYLVVSYLAGIFPANNIPQWLRAGIGGIAGFIVGEVID